MPACLSTPATPSVPFRCLVRASFQSVRACTNKNGHSGKKDVWMDGRTAECLSALKRNCIVVGTGRDAGVVGQVPSYMPAGVYS